MELPKKWTDVYPYGTKAGDEEATFFKKLARHHKFKYRSVAQLVKETGLSQLRIEEIIDKYANKFNPPLIYQHPTNEDTWGYWERIPDDLPTDDSTISQQDQNKRIGKQLQSTPDLVINDADSGAIVITDRQSLLSHFGKPTQISPFVKITENDLTYTEVIH